MDANAHSIPFLKFAPAFAVVRVCSRVFPAARVHERAVARFRNRSAREKDHGPPLLAGAEGRAKQHQTVGAIHLLFTPWRSRQLASERESHELLSLELKSLGTFGHSLCGRKPL